MKIILNQAVLAYQTFMQLKDEKMPLKTAYKLNSLMMQLEKEVEFYNQKLNAIIKENALTDKEGQYVFTENGSGIKVKPDKIEECSLLMKELDQLEVEIKDTFLSLDELNDLTISISELQNIAPFIIE